MRWILLSIVVASTVAADLLQSFTMRRESDADGSAPGVGQVLRLIFQRRYLLLSILAMAISFFAFLALVETEPLSFAVPASAGSFVLETLLARALLGEIISFRRGAGAVLVTAGILLISR